MFCEWQIFKILVHIGDFNSFFRRYYPDICYYVKIMSRQCVVLTDCLFNIGLNHTLAKKIAVQIAKRSFGVSNNDRAIENRKPYNTFSPRISATTSDFLPSDVMYRNGPVLRSSYDRWTIGLSGATDKRGELSSVIFWTWVWRKLDMFSWTRLIHRRCSCPKFIWSKPKSNHTTISLTQMSLRQNIKQIINNTVKCPEQRCCNRVVQACRINRLEQRSAMLLQ